MLRELHIENFALIQELNVSFGDGLNILTGETGAGKSIIIDAINQVLGERASVELVRSGEERAVVTGVIEANTGLLPRLAELGLSTQEGCVVLQREIYANGRSQARIDGRPVSLGVLREISGLLVEIHGQQEHQALLDEGAHLALVDAFGGAELAAAKDRYQTVWTELVAYKKQIAALHGDERERERLLDLLQYQVDEIEQAGLSPGEEESLGQELKLIQNARKLLEVCRFGYQALYESEGERSVVETLAALVAGLKEFSGLAGALEQACAQVEESLYSLEDAARQLRSFADSFAYDPQREQAVSERLQLIHDLKRKYADSVAGVLAWQAERIKEIEAIRNTAARHAELSQLADAAASRAGQLALELSQVRRRAGKELAVAIVDELAYLQMANSRFEVEFMLAEASGGLPAAAKFYAATATGIDSVRFLIAPNLGEPLKPLTRIASGGEMSRIMLALLNVLARLRSVDTLIFDEIDAGIGGRAAQAVAEKLAAVAASRQVICVSHLPQISSMADTHLFIYKEQAGERTLTKISRLDMAGRVEELARMLGGAEVTAGTREHAREMLALASKTKIKN